MRPFRAFLLSLAGGFALLFGAQGLILAMQPAQDARIGEGPIRVPTA